MRYCEALIHSSGGEINTVKMSTFGIHRLDWLIVRT